MKSKSELRRYRSQMKGKKHTRYKCVFDGNVKDRKQLNEG